MYIRDSMDKTYCNMDGSSDFLSLVDLKDLNTK